MIMYLHGLSAIRALESLPNGKEKIEEVEKAFETINEQLPMASLKLYGYFESRSNPGYIKVPVLCITYHSKIEELRLDFKEKHYSFLGELLSEALDAAPAPLINLKLED